MQCCSATPSLLSLGLDPCTSWPFRLRSAPPTHTPPPQIVTVKNRYVILNETGFAIEYKQCGSPDPGMQAVRPLPLLCMG